MNVPVGTYIRNHREAQKMSLRVLAERVGIAYPYLSQIESGKFTPSADTLVNIAKALDLDPDDAVLLAGKAPPDLLQRLQTDREFVRQVRALETDEEG